MAGPLHPSQVVGPHLQSQVDGLHLVEVDFLLQVEVDLVHPVEVDLLHQVEVEVDHLVKQLLPQKHL